MFPIAVVAVLAAKAVQAVLEDDQGERMGGHA